MFTPILCGNFQDEEEDELELLIRSCSATKKSSRKSTRRSNSFGGGKDSKNPYANRGLDKFSALLAELDSQRQKIYTQKGSEDISLLGFTYDVKSNYKPIVVKLRDRKQDKKTEIYNHQDKTIKTTGNSQFSDKKDVVVDAKTKTAEMESNIVKDSTQEMVSFRFLWNKKIKWENFRQPSYYFPAVIIMILVFLALFGKSFAIFCVSISWYIIPTIKSSEQSSNLKKRKGLKKDDDGKTLDQNKNINKNIVRRRDHLSAPSSPISVLAGEKSPPLQGSPLHQGHRRSF